MNHRRITAVPSLAQLIRCDKAAWARLSSVISDVRQAADGSYPLGLDEIRPARCPVCCPSCQATAIVEFRSLETTTVSADLFAEQPSSEGQGRQGQSEREEGWKVPQELRGKWHKTLGGGPICFAFNCKSGCSDTTVTPGGRCAKRFHVCAGPGCQGAHSLQQHHAAGGA